MSRGPGRPRKYPVGMQCTVDGCETVPAKLKLGMCGTHYERFRKHGDPNVALLGRPRIHEKKDPTEMAIFHMRKAIKRLTEADTAEITVGQYVVTVKPKGESE